ncbi:hypothetical protein GJ496_006140 [Pomphorhynchus laevis]|nr:hypothetical protein GJ496_006140 [Pomphorhynchus laevis]
MKMSITYGDALRMSHNCDRSVDIEPFMQNLTSTLLRRGYHGRQIQQHIERVRRHHNSRIPICDVKTHLIIPYHPHLSKLEK